MKNTGALLKSKRESSNLSLSEVALATKINPKILAAIENGDENNLPAKTFLKGFVRSYALFLKMDVDTVMRSFQDETGGPPPAPMNEIAKAEAAAPSSRRRVGDESSSGMRTVAVVVIVVLIGLIIGVRELIEKYQREKVVESTADIKVVPVVPVAGAPVAAAPGTVAVATTEQPAVAPAEAAAKAPEVKLAEVPKASDTVAPTTDTVKPTDTAKETTETVEVKAAVAETKPADTRTPEQKAAAEAARPIMAARPIDLIRGPINNLVELRPFELAPIRPIEMTKMSDKDKMIETTPHVEPVAEVKPTTLKAEDKPTPAPAPEVISAKVEAPKVAEVKKAAEAPKPADTPKPASIEATPADANTAATAGLKNAKNEIILEALDKVEVKFEVKGEVKKVSLAKSEVHTIRSDVPMTLDLSDGGAVNIILNGRERGVPGDVGKPKTIKIP